MPALVRPNAASDRNRAPHASAAPRGLASAQARGARLAVAVETQIVPRLALACAATPLLAPDAPEVAVLVDLLRADAAAADLYVEMLRADGAPLDRICLDLLAPAARRLGSLWDEDACDFTEVTIGLSRLHRMLRQLGPSLHPDRGQPAGVRRILLTPCSGEQHQFGLAMVAAFFRRAGWDVLPDPVDGLVAAAALLRRDRVDVVGISVGCDDRLDRLAAGIHALRRASCNPALAVMVGGPAFAAHPETIALVGADATSADARHAPREAEALLARMAVRA